MNSVLENVVSPVNEMLSWEILWATIDTTQKKLSADFERWNARLPSQALACAKQEELLPFDDIEENVRKFIGHLRAKFSVCVSGTFHYPRGLRDAQYPVELFYYAGDVGLLESCSVSIVGARKCSEEGAARARRLAKELVGEGYSIVSGLAKGIDTAAMESTIENGGNTIGVIGTPINDAYPKENATLQAKISSEHLTRHVSRPLRPDRR